MQPQSTRLNKVNRTKFINVVLEDKIPESSQPSRPDFKNRWEDKIYDIVYGPYIEQMNKLPDWFFSKSKHMTVSFSLSKQRSGVMRFDLGQMHKIVLQQRYSGDVAAPVPEDHKITQEYNALVQQEDDYRLRRNELQKQLANLVDSCNTSAQLFTAWPEALKYKECFPYVPRAKFQGAAVSQHEMEIGTLLAQTTVTLPEEK